MHLFSLLIARVPGPLAVIKKNNTCQMLRYSKADQEDVNVEPEYFIIHPTTVPGMSLQKDSHYRGLQIILRPR